MEVCENMGVVKKVRKGETQIAGIFCSTTKLDEKYGCCQTKEF